MEKRPLLIKEMLLEGWHFFKKNAVILILFQIVIVLLGALMQFSGEGLIGLLIVILLWAASIIVSIGLINSTLLITKDIKPTVHQMYKNWQFFFPYLFAAILFTVMFGIGLILLIVPGLYILARYALYPYFIVDKKNGPIESLENAGSHSEGYRWKLFLLYVILFIFNVIGIALVVGIVLVPPYTWMVLAVAYKHIVEHEEVEIDAELLTEEDVKEIS
ncbi:MAG: hypothetical protein Tsb0021_16760 [Chlamydiales bacterium]